MNYFAHGRNHLERPYFVAGTALPDWLNVVDRRTRVRSAKVRPFAQSADSVERQLAAGVVQHHTDDDWFHRTRAFAELSWEFTVTIRDHLPVDDGFRPSFLGHILVEILLDDWLVRQDAHTLAAYYACLEEIEPGRVADFVARATGREVPGMARFIRLFLEVRFLYDYAEDAKLLLRLNQVMRRVGLPELPDQLRALWPRLRAAVDSRATELLQPPCDATSAGWG